MSDDAESQPRVASERPGCGNCGKPAYMLLGDFPVCIDCKYKVDMSQWMQFAQAAAMMNHASQEIDFVVGLGPRSPQIQIPRPPVPPISYNNQTVSVSGGTVGAINFGNVRDIQVNLQALTQAGTPDIVQPLSDLASAVLNANDADEQKKNDLLEQIAAITALANAKPEDRKPGMVKALLSAIKEGSNAVSAAAGAWQAVEPMLKGHFGI